MLVAKLERNLIQRKVNTAGIVMIHDASYRVPILVAGKTLYVEMNEQQEPKAMYTMSGDPVDFVRDNAQLSLLSRKDNEAMKDELRKGIL